MGKLKDAVIKLLHKCTALEVRVDALTVEVEDLKKQGNEKQKLAETSVPTAHEGLVFEPAVQRLVVLGNFSLSLDTESLLQIFVIIC